MSLSGFSSPNTDTFYNNNDEFVDYKMRRQT